MVTENLDWSFVTTFELFILKYLNCLCAGILNCLNNVPVGWYSVSQPIYPLMVINIINYIECEAKFIIQLRRIFVLNICHFRCKTFTVNICLLLLLFVSRLCWQVHQTWNVDFLGSYSYSGVQILRTVLSSPTGNMAFRYVYTDLHLKLAVTVSWEICSNESVLLWSV
jgi:hypothetical protein